MALHVIFYVIIITKYFIFILYCIKETNSALLKRGPHNKASQGLSNKCLPLAGAAQSFRKEYYRMTDKITACVGLIIEMRGND